MSAASLATNYTKRTRKAPADATAKSVPKQLAQWIPTEALTAYAALVGLFGATLTGAQAFSLLGAGLLLDVALVWYLAVLATEEGKKDQAAGRPLWKLFWQHKPVVEILLSAAAFALWIGALPGSYTSHIPNWQPQIGSALVVLATIVIPALAVVAGTRSPNPAAETKKTVKPEVKNLKAKGKTLKPEDKTPKPGDDVLAPAAEIKRNAA